MKKLATIFGVLLVLVLLSIPTTLAQGNTAPIININGDIWTWDTPGLDPVQLTQWGFNEDMTISPDGAWIAYNSWPLSVINRQQAGTEFFWFGTVPTNIWVMQTATRTFRRIAVQPVNDDVTYQNGLLRSATAWSPDSTRLAWIELDIASDAPNPLRIMIHNVYTGNTRMLVPSISLGFQDAGIFLPPLHWDALGLHFEVPTFVEAVGEFRNLVQIIDPVTQNVREYYYEQPQLG